MKQKLKALSIVLCLLCAGMTVHANELPMDEQWQTMATDDGAIEVSMPEEWLMFTQETVPDQQFCDERGIERDSLIDNVNFASDGMFMLRVRDNGMVLLHRSSLPVAMDLKSANDAVKEGFLEGLQESFANTEGEVKVEYQYPYEGASNFYYVFNVYDNRTQEVIRRIYITVSNRDSIMFMFEGSDEIISDSEFQEKFLDKIKYISSEITLESTEEENDNAFVRQVGRTIGSMVSSVIIGLILSGIIVMCVNAGKKR